MTATPVIDDATGIMYVVNYDTAHDQHVLHALDLHGGLAEVLPPVVIAALAGPAPSGHTRNGIRILAPGGLVPRAVIRHGAFDRKDAAIIVGDDEKERGGRRRLEHAAS